MTRSSARRARLTRYGAFVLRPEALPPATGASQSLFTVTGRVLLTSFFGYVTEAVPNEVLSLDIAHDPDDGASDVVLASAGSIQAKAAGTWLYLNTAVAGALTTRFEVGTNVQLNSPHSLTPGVIKVGTTGGGDIGTTARIEWGLTYVPLSTYGEVAAV